MAGVWIIGEHRDGAFRKITFEVASAAKTIADELGAEVTAVVLGQGMEDACKELGQYGVSKVLYADGEAFAKYTTDAYANAAAALIKDAAPDGALSGASKHG